MDLDLLLTKGDADAEELEAVHRALVTVLARRSARPRPRVVLSVAAGPTASAVVPVRFRS